MFSYINGKLSPRRFEWYEHIEIWLQYALPPILFSHPKQVRAHLHLFYSLFLCGGIPEVGSTTIKIYSVCLREAWRHRTSKTEKGEFSRFLPTVGAANGSNHPHAKDSLVLVPSSVMTGLSVTKITGLVLALRKKNRASAKRTCTSWANVYAVRWDNYRNRESENNSPGVRSHFILLF